MRIVIFGDSLTSGYQLQPEEAFPSKLERKLREIGYQNIEVLNMSISGETSTGGAERIHSVLAKKPDIVMVELGANDVRRGINPNIIYRNLADILGKLLHENIYVILVGVRAPPNMEYTYTKQVENVYDKLAEFYKVPFYPFVLEGIYEQPELNLADGFHPNAQGVTVMVENMYRMVDAGLRWRWEMMQYEQQYQQKYTQPYQEKIWHQLGQQPPESN